MIDKSVETLFKAGRVNEARVLAGFSNESGFYAKDEAQDNFTHQNSYGPHQHFDNCGKDWKKYFFVHDALHNLEDDIVFSIFDRYRCDFRCKTCYLNKQWMTDDEFFPFIPSKISNEDIDNYLDIFSSFYRVGAIDDLCLVKKESPHLFELFKNYAHLMEHNITDIGFFAQFDILMNECDFDKTAYLSFSDHIIDRNDGKIVDKVIPMIRDLHEKSPIRKMNFIMSKGYATENKNIMKVFEWIVSNTDIETFFHTDHCVDKDHVADLKAKYGYDLPSIYYIENTFDPPIVCQILTETIQMRNKSMYSTLTGSTLFTGDERITEPFYRYGDKWDIYSFLSHVVEGKIKTYDYYQSVMTSKEGNRYWEYFFWCKDNLKVNHDYTFIPATMLNPWTNMAKKLLENNFINTYAGYLKKGATKVIPIVEVC